jgi:hypothetical protein
LPIDSHATHEAGTRGAVTYDGIRDSAHYYYFYCWRDYG